jgi:hypothetical protein
MEVTIFGSSNELFSRSLTFKHATADARLESTQFFFPLKRLLPIRKLSSE